MRLALVATILVCFATTAHAVLISTKIVGNAGNSADTRIMDDGTRGYGAINYRYSIGTYDVTNAQYAEFLNAKAAISDPYGLYNVSMASGTQGGITRTGSGPFSYSVNAGYANKPVVRVSWFDALRFANWLTNGQGAGDTETGTYAITGGGVDSGTVTVPTAIQRADWANSTTPHWLLPSESEWYKAAYYKGGSTNAGYWLYPFQSNTVPTGDVPPGGSNSANFYGDHGYAVTQTTPLSSFNSSLTYLTDVGAYAAAQSPFGAFDMGGNVWQWNEALLGPTHGVRGGAWDFFSGDLAASRRFFDPLVETTDIGFRVALVPEPGSFALLAIGGAGFLLWARRRKP